MNSVVYELSPLQKTIWLNVSIRRPMILGNHSIPKKKKKKTDINTLKRVSHCASTSISGVLVNCLEAALLYSSMFSLALPVYVTTMALHSWADQYRLELVLITGSLIFNE